MQNLQPGDRMELTEKGRAENKTAKDYISRLAEARQNAAQLQEQLGNVATVTVRQAYPKIYIDVAPRQRD